LSKVFNFDLDEIAANPVHLMYVLEKQLELEELPKDRLSSLLNIIKGSLGEKYMEFLEKQIRMAFMDSYSEYGQTIFDRYVLYADHYINDEAYIDFDTKDNWDKTALNDELEKIEKPAGIVNPKDFRNEVVNFVMRYKANNSGKSPAWNSFQKMADVIEKKIFTSTEEILPVISFNGSKQSKKDQESHESFVSRMTAMGYTRKQTRLLVEWWMRVRRNS
jgi:serine protein kinase